MGSRIWSLVDGLWEIGVRKKATALPSPRLPHPFTLIGESRVIGIYVYNMYTHTHTHTHTHTRRKTKLKQLTLMLPPVLLESRQAAGEPPVSFMIEC